MNKLKEKLADMFQYQPQNLTRIQFMMEQKHETSYSNKLRANQRKTKLKIKPDDIGKFRRCYSITSSKISSGTAPIPNTVS